MAIEGVNGQQTSMDVDPQIQGYANDLVQKIQKLRQENGISEDESIAVYVTNTEIVRSLFKQERSYIEEKTNAVDIVQINVDGGIPIPDGLPQIEWEVGDQTVTIAISPSGDEK